jgi:putative hydrolase of the HAD superfamily
VIEKTTLSALKDILSMKGFPDVPEPTLRAALDALYAVTQKNWHLEKDTIPTLEILQKRGFRLGMISNTSDEDNVQQLLDRWRLRPYFEHIITSAGCGIRKPDERIFRLALDQFNLLPGQAVMVGDSPEADILGAHRLGIYSIWITRRVENPDPGPIPPDAVVQNLSEITSLIPGLPSSS